MDTIDLATILTTTDPEPDHIVKGMLYRGQVILIAGEPGVGKSFLQYNLSLCIAGGLDFLGMPTAPGKVLYFDEENSRPDLHQYLRWIWRGLGEPDIPTLAANLHIEHFTLARHGHKRYDYMAQVAAQVQPALIVIDTVTPCCAIAEENDNGEASRAMRALRRVKESAGPLATMVLLKHAKFTHDPTEKQTIRGAKTWLGEADGVIYHKLVVGKPRGDGLRNSCLTPDKTRAFGLRSDIRITPAWCGNDPQKGIILTRF